MDLRIVKAKKWEIFISEKFILIFFIETLMVAMSKTK